MYGCTFDKEKQKQKLSLFDSRLKRKTLTIAVKKRMSIFLGKNAKTPALRRSSATKSKSILKQRFSVKFDESTIIRDFQMHRQESKSE